MWFPLARAAQTITAYLPTPQTERFLLGAAVLGASEGAKYARRLARLGEGGLRPVSPRGLSPGQPRRVSDEGREGRP